MLIRKTILPMLLTAALMAVGCGDGDDPQDGTGGTIDSSGGSGGTVEPGEGGSGGTNDPGFGGSGGSDDPGFGGSGGSDDPGFGGSGGSDDPGFGGSGGSDDPGEGGSGGMEDPSGAGGSGGFGGEGGTIELPEAASLTLEARNCLQIGGICPQMKVGETRLLQVTVKDADGEVIPDAPVHWVSSNPAIVTPVESGVLALEAGEADITISSGEVSQTITFTASWVQITRVDVSDGKGNFKPLLDVMEDKLLLVEGHAYMQGRFMEDVSTLAFPTWEVGDPSILRIEEHLISETSGNPMIALKALRPGTTTVKLSADPRQLQEGVLELTKTIDVEVWIAAIEPAEFVVSSLEMGNFFACGISSGVSHCWGDNNYKKLGANSPNAQELYPVPLAGGRTFTSLAPGFYHACGLEADGAAWCWGRGNDGQLAADDEEGNVNQADSPVTAAAGMKFKSLVAKDAHTCGIDLDDKPWCWGHNQHGRLGVGLTGSARYRVPTAVAGEHRFKEMALANAFGCAIDDQNLAWCWGTGTNGTLGMGKPDGAAPPRQNAPVQVLGGHRFTELVTGGVHACALREDRTVWCWGRGAEGQLGIPPIPGDFVSASFEPVQVQGGLLFDTIAAGSNHGCGIDDRGKAWCWGDNSIGQLGTGELVSGHLPVAVFGDLVFTDIAASGNTTCGSTSAGLYCWGDGELGQYGNGSMLSRPIPMPVKLPQLP